VSYLKRLAARSTPRPPVFGRSTAITRSAVVDPFAAASEGEAPEALAMSAPTAPLPAPTPALARTAPLVEADRPRAPVVAVDRPAEEKKGGIESREVPLPVPPAVVPQVPVRAAPIATSPPAREVVIERERVRSIPAPTSTVVTERRERVIAPAPAAAAPAPPRVISPPVAPRTAAIVTKPAERSALRAPSPQIVIGRVSVTIEGPPPKIAEAPRRTIVVPSKQASPSDDKLGLGLGQR
jgi:hypothetical protein